MFLQHVTAFWLFMNDRIPQPQTMADLVDEWESFMKGTFSTAQTAAVAVLHPAPSPLYFSTQTYITQLNRHIDLKELFWGLELISYDTHEAGLCKKQMKFTSTSQREVEDLEERLALHPLHQTFIIRKTVTDDKFKDIRKVSIGMSKKDLTLNKVKSKGAFFNCLVVNVRIFIGKSTFKDHHVKLFNTGNVEIPGIQDSAHVPLIMDVVERSIRKLHPIDRVPEYKIVLINSHFNVNFFVNRDNMYRMLRDKYGIAAIYDPCSYPGVQCKLYYTPEVEIVTRAKEYMTFSVSVMIFRTGSVLIVGKCNEEVIHSIYRYLNEIFEANFVDIVDSSTNPMAANIKKEKKIKKLVLKK
jgi:TATA-box binding protein (TBP) (component of TFIID and TFIIIB)